MSDKFDLAKAQAGEPIMTRDGKMAKFIAYVPELANNKQLMVVIELKPNKWVQFNYHVDGKVTDLGSNDRDLFMAPKPVILYANVYNDRLFHHDSIDLCKENSENGKLAISICRITIINGAIAGTETVHVYEQDSK